MQPVIFSLLDTPAYGGAEQYLLAVLKHLALAKWRVVLATNNPTVKEKCQGSRVEVISLPYRLDAIGNWKGLIKYFFGVLPALVWLTRTVRGLQSRAQGTEVKMHGSDSVPLTCIFPGYTDRLSFSPVVRLLRCRLIWLEYGPLEPTFARNHGFPKILYAIGRPFVQRVVTISQWTKQSLLTTGKIPAKKIQIIYPGVTRSRSTDRHLRVRMGKRQEKEVRRLITIARLATEKEIDLLLYAWKEVQTLHCPYQLQLRIVGDGPLRTALEHIAASLGVADSVEFTGFVRESRKQELLRQSDLFVFPSAWELEGFGMTTIEAMASGVPVISTGAGPQREIIQDGVTGYLFRAHDASSLASTIYRALTDPHRAVIAQAAQDKVGQVFSLEQMLTAWRRLVGDSVEAA